MELGNVVRFASHPRPFLVKDEYCDNAECSCNEVFLTFTEISDAGELLRTPLSFRARIDLDTWEETDRTQRPPEVADWVREFLRKCPPSRRDEFRASYQDGKRMARRMAEYTIDPDEVIEGKLVSFAHILTEEGALSEGGCGYTYHFLHQEREYLIEDRYCPNPNCDCECVQVEFFESVPAQDGKNRSASIFPRFLGKVTFDGHVKVVERAKCSLAEAKDVLTAWWREYRKDLPMFQRRYRQVKEIGQRNLDANPKRHARFGQRFPGDDPPPEVVADDRLPEKIRVGRNDPCPCGSGKKYKKCCWRKETTQF